MINNCDGSHKHSLEARNYAYKVLYIAQKDSEHDLSWREEHDIFITALHEYDFPSQGKIDEGDQKTN